MTCQAVRKGMAVRFVVRLAQLVSCLQITRRSLKFGMSC